jgi:hypothetical protein
MPKGSIWEPAVSGDLDKTYDGIGQILDLMNDKLEQSRYIRSPYKTSILSDLEKEFGIITNELLSEDTRRMQLQQKKNKKRSTAAADYLQALLINSGFTVQVHRNDPPADPAIFLDQNFQMVAGQAWAIAGHEDAYAGRIGGELLVNGDEFTYTTAYDAQAGGATTYAGNSSAVAGFFTSLGKIPIVYEIPTDPLLWSYVFFVGGDAIRDGSGKLTSIEQAQVPSERRSEFLKIILSVKPLFTWAGLVIVFN